MQHSQPVLLIQFSVPKTRSSELCFYIILWNATWYAVLTILKKAFLAPLVFWSTGVMKLLTPYPKSMFYHQACFIFTTQVTNYYILNQTGTSRAHALSKYCFFRFWLYSILKWLTNWQWKIMWPRSLCQLFLQVTPQLHNMSSHSWLKTVHSQTVPSKKKKSRERNYF